MGDRRGEALPLGDGCCLWVHSRGRKAGGECSRNVALLLLHAQKWSIEVPPQCWAGTRYAVALLSMLNWEQQYVLMHSSKCWCILHDWSKRRLLFLLSSFLSFPFQFGCHGYKHLLVKTAMCNFFILVYRFSFFEEGWQKAHVKKEVFIKPDLNAVHFWKL